jgi:hypothetical protein
MKTLVLAAGLAALGAAAHAGAIEQACMASSRAGASRALCGCIQHAADMTLTRADQRLAAKFFRDPQQAQDIRQSSSRSHEIFWEKYKNFGATAEAYCSAG